MGARFRLEHANIVGYLTSRSYGAPRTRKKDLHDFLKALAWEHKDYLIAEEGDREWIDLVSGKARDALKLLGLNDETSDLDIFFGGELERALEPLRIALSDHPLFALAVGNESELYDKAQSIARDAMDGQLLVLLPRYYEATGNFRILDTIPAFSAVLHAAADWPGIGFWTPSGASAFAPLDRADELWRNLKHAYSLDRIPRPGGEPAKYDRVLNAWSEQQGQRGRRLLHLSDLHFGTRQATENQPLLDAELRDVVKTVDRVVITGDLIDSPSADSFARFLAFRNNITHLAGGIEPIAITGNHDQRLKGLVGRNYEQVARLKSMGVEPDDKSEMVFLLLNSSIRGKWARGRITTPQLKQVGAEYRTLIAARPDLKRFLPVVLVHHHPFSFDAEPETLLQRLLAKLGMREEKLLEMVDAADFHHWCVDWGFTTILHGHKHKYRYEARPITHRGRTLTLTSIGCGSSLGAERSPVSYNLLEWHPGQERWIASLFESVNGGAFREVMTSVSPRNSLEPPAP